MYILTITFFFFFWLRWVFVVGVFVAACGLSLVAVHGLLIAVASRFRARLLGVRASVVAARGLSSCGSWAVECRLSNTGLVAPWHVGSSRTRARTRVPCIGRRILNHCATREVLTITLKKNSFKPRLSELVN